MDASVPAAPMSALVDLPRAGPTFVKHYTDEAPLMTSLGMCSAWVRRRVRTSFKAHLGLDAGLAQGLAQPLAEKERRVLTPSRDQEFPPLDHLRV